MAETLETLLQMGKERLEKAGIQEADLDAWYLLSDAFQVNRTHYFLDKKRILQEECIQAGYEKYQSMLAKREQRVPLQQILGSQEFMALPFFVNEHVLIPRQDTETLVEQVLSECRETQVRLLDMCTGSGCIALSLAVLGGYQSVTAADLSEEALKVAIQNIRTLYLGEKFRGRGSEKLEFWEEVTVQEAPLKVIWNCRDIQKKKTEFSLLKSDLFTNLDPVQKFDILVSNPPYIPSKVIEGLEPEVRQHEPMMALDGREDGLYFYRKLAEEAGNYLNDQARIYFEIGHDQGEALKKLLETHGFKEIRILKDLAGNDRVAAAVWSAKDDQTDARDALKCGGDGPH